MVYEKVYMNVKLEVRRITLQSLGKVWDNAKLLLKYASKLKGGNI